MNSINLINTQSDIEEHPDGAMIEADKIASTQQKNQDFKRAQEMPSIPLSSGISMPELDESPQPNPAPDIDPSAQEVDKPQITNELPQSPTEPTTSVAEQAIVPRSKQEHWQRILNANLDSIPAELREQAGANDPSLSAEEQDQQLYCSINRSWVVDHLDKPKEEVLARWPAIRAELSKEEKVGEDEQDIYYALSEKQQRDDLSEVYRSSYQSSLLDKQSNSSPRPTSEQAQQLSKQAQAEALEARQRFAPLASDIATGIQALLSPERNMLSYPEDVASSLPILRNAAKQLNQMDKRERSAVYQLALKQHQATKPSREPESLMSKASRSFRRSNFNIGLDMGQTLAYISASTLDSMGDGLDDLLGSDMQGAAQKIDKRARILKELSDLAQHQADPIELPEGAGLPEQIALDIAASTPQAILGFGGGIGFGSLAFSAVGASIAEARKRSPEGDIQLQTAAGLMGGAIQAGIYMGMGSIGRRVIERSISNFSRASATGIKGYSIAALETAGAITAENAKLLLAGKAATSVDLALQELASRCDSTASNIDWSSYGNQMLDIELNMREAAANLPFILIGSGRVALRHFRDPAGIVAQHDQLRHFGLKEPQIKQITKESHIDRQGEQLQLALRGSKRWSGAGFLKEAIAALRLLNTDYFKAFNDPNTVCSFLRLPSSDANIKRKEAKFADIEQEAILSELGRKHGADPHKFRMANALQIRDLWWQKANLDRHIPENIREQSPAQKQGYIEKELDNHRKIYLKEILSGSDVVPKRMQRISRYSPLAEAERQALLRDRSAELKDLSYQYLLNISPLETLTKTSDSSKAIQSRTEKKRRFLLMRTARAVMKMNMGMNREEALSDIESGMYQHYRHERNNYDSPSWLQKTSPNKLNQLCQYAAYSAKEMTKTGLPPEYFQAMRITLGLQANANLLYELIPMTDDYVAALAEGMSPLQASSHILMRELELDAKEFKDYPIERITQSATAEDIQKLDADLAPKFETYCQLTGTGMNHAEAEDGSSLWRIATPDGGHSHWHDSEAKVIRELFLRYGHIFRPIGEGSNPELLSTLNEGSFKLEPFVPNHEPEFSGFDHLCMEAMQSMHQQATMRQEGLQRHRLKYRIGRIISQSILDMPIEHPKQKSRSKDRIKNHGNLLMDEISINTPFGLVKARSAAHWQQLLDAGMIEPQNAANFLISSKTLNAQEAQDILDTKKASPKRAGWQYFFPGALDHKIDERRRNQKLAHALGTLSADYFGAHIEHQQAPYAVKQWIRSIPLCPPEPAYKELAKVNLGYKRSNVQRWCNRQTAQFLQQRAPRWQELREIKESIQSLDLAAEFSRGIGESPERIQERAWSHYISQGRGDYTPRAELWQLLCEPLPSWRKLSEEAQLLLSESLSEQHKLRAQATQPMDVEQQVSNLDAVLNDYPNLMLYHHDPRRPELIMKLELSGLPELDIHKEPQQEVRVWQEPVEMDDGYKIRHLNQLPVEMRDDPRVMPAIHFVSSLRSLSINRPQASAEGIWYRGDVYGHKHQNIAGTDEAWRPRPALNPIMDALRIINERIEASGSTTLEIGGTRFSATPEELDMQRAEHVSIYRDPHNESNILRLMPGDPLNLHKEAQRPHVVHQRNGVYFIKNRAIRQPEELIDSLQPFEYYQFYHLREHNENTRQELGVAMPRLLLDSIIQPSISENIDNPDALQLEELLLRVAEDSGLAHEIQQRGIDELTPPQLGLLKLIQQMIILEYGDRSPQHRNKWDELCQELHSNPTRVRRMALAITDLQEKYQFASDRLIKQLIREGKMEDKKKPGRTPHSINGRQMRAGI